MRLVWKKDVAVRVPPAPKGPAERDVETVYPLLEREVESVDSNVEERDFLGVRRGRWSPFLD